ncbi:MAG: metallophosphoesterase family protein [Candidatus Bathyarchaeales archaeon]
MVKIGVFADTHVGRSIPNVISEYRRKAFRHAFSQAIDVFIQEGVDYVFHAGDLFEKRSMTPSDSLFVKEELQRLVDSLNENVKILLIRGNHDGTTENSALNYVEHPLARYLKVLGEKTLQGECDIYEEDSFAVVGLGYTPYASTKLAEVKDKIKEQFEKTEQQHKIFLTHMFVEGQEIPPNVPEYQVANFNIIKNLEANLVIAGHYHKYLPLKEKENVLLLIPGATEAIDLSDEWPHGVCILNLKQQIDCKFIPLKPLHKIKNELVDSKGATQQPKWFIEKAVTVANKFSEALTSEDVEGILRIALRGIVDGNRFDLEAEIERRMQEIRKENERLLHVEIDNGLSELALGGVSVPEHMGRDEFLQEVFSLLGEKGMAQALSLAEEVRMTLEEKASAQTGLLKESDRKPFVEKWLKILEVE